MLRIRSQLFSRYARLLHGTSACVAQILRRTPGFSRELAFAVLLTALPAGSALAQDAANAPASVPAGATPPQPSALPAKPIAAAIRPALSAKQARDADDAYLEGAKLLTHKDLAGAQRSFERAVELNPGNRDYALALIVTREDHVNELVHQAAHARLSGDSARADDLLAQARALDPDNPVVAQHFQSGLMPTSPPVDLQARNLRVANLQRQAQAATFDPAKFPVQDIASTLAGPVEFDPLPGTKSLHLHGDVQTVVRGVYSAFGLQVTFDSSVTSGPQITLDLDDVDFAGANRVLDDMAHVFAVAVQPKEALVAKDTQEDRDRLLPQVEETIYLPGITPEEMTELANLARTIFNIRQVTASASGDDMLLRGDERTLQLVNATFAEVLNGGSDVLFDIDLYEIDKTHMNNIGATLPTSAGIFSVAAEAQQLVNANQTLINQAIAAGALNLTGSPLQNLITEVGFLIASGTVSAAQYTNLLGIFGGGLTLAGLYLGSNSTFHLMLSSSDVRTLDAIQLRSASGQDATFKAGTRYPIVTATYSSGVSSSLASSLAGLNINGTSVSSLLSQYLGSTSVNVPQFQYEDLGINLKLTPRVLAGGDVAVKLDMKIEALGGGMIDSIPILNNRAIVSTVTIPAGQTAMLATLVNTNEIGSIDGLPGLSELPGFVGTDKDVEHDSDELLITITPHIVRPAALRIASRRLAVPHAAATE
jgi:general secretion pathway protein D